MLKYSMLLLILAIVAAFPADNKMDKEAQNEITANLATDKDITDTEKNQSNRPFSVTLGVNIPAADDNTQTRNGTSFTITKNQNIFTRLIDDIFQIPITVLQSVSKLLTNPFTQRNKDEKDASVA